MLQSKGSVVRWYNESGLASVKILLAADGLVHGFPLRIVFHPEDLGSWDLRDPRGIIYNNIHMIYLYIYRLYIYTIYIYIYIHVYMWYIYNMYTYIYMWYIIYPWYIYISPLWWNFYDLSMCQIEETIPALNILEQWQCFRSHSGMEGRGSSRNSPKALEAWIAIFGGSEPCGREEAAWICWWCWPICPTGNPRILD